jgi:hypothetical protein
VKLFNEIDSHKGGFLAEEQPEEPPQPLTELTGAAENLFGPIRRLFKRPEPEKRSHELHVFLDSETAV